MELSRCLFSLICNEYRDIRIIICAQRFTMQQLNELRVNVERIIGANNNIEVVIANFDDSYQIDARSCLLNMGINSAIGRYIAFLDYDDVIYPGAYVDLINELRHSNSLIAFGRIAVKGVAAYEKLHITLTKEFPFNGRNCIDLFKENFCPIHSYVLDRAGIYDYDLRFEECLTRCEDYDFLLRICSKYKSSFTLIDKIIGEYYYKNDGSNTTLAANSSEENRLSWAIAREFLNSRRKLTGISIAVQDELGICPQSPSLTIADFLKTLNKRQS